MNILKKIFCLALLIAFPTGASAITFTNVDTSSGSASIAISTDSHARLGYVSSDKARIKLASWNGASWSTQTVDSTYDYHQYARLTSVAVDTMNVVSMAYTGASANLRYAKWNGASWDVETVDTNSYEASLVLNSSGNPCIAYHNLTARSLKYAVWNGASWDKQTVESSSTGYRPFLVLDSSGNPHISYYNKGKKTIKLAAFHGVSWSTQTIATAYSGDWTSSIAIDSSSIVHAVYTAPTKDVMHAYEYAGGWRAARVAQGYMPFLAISSTGTLCVSYNGQGDRLNYASWTGSAWVITFISSSGKASALALSNTDVPNISFYNAANYISYKEIAP